MTTRKAFTLIELLVVIAVISVLASILFPVFARARENARRASCMSNMKQIGLGIMQYTQDYDDHYPLGWYGRKPGVTYGSYTQNEPGTPGATFVICDPGSCTGGGQGHFYTWMDMIYPYVKSTQVFVCPSSQNPKPAGGLIPNYWMNGAYGNTASSTLDSTTANHYPTTYYGKTILHTGTPMSAINRPSESVMIFEASAPNNNPLYLVNGKATWLVRPNWDALFRTHLDGINLTFGDGHVKWMSYANIASQTGDYDTTACNLNSIADKPFCSQLWNPFLP